MTPRPMRERDAATELGVSVHTLRRERQRGRIGFVLIASRPCYLDRHLQAYLDAREVKPCDAVTAPARLATSGFPSAPTPPSGAGPGSTPPADRRAAHRLALTTLQPPASPSPDGSRCTGTVPRSNRATC